MENRVQRGNGYRMADASQIPPCDRLSTLPPELLSLIFDFVRLANGDRQMIEGISKALLPYTESNLYHQVSIESFGDFDRFQRATVAPTRSPYEEIEHRARYLASLVKIFKVRLRWEDEVDPRWNKVDVVGLFSALRSLDEIDVEYCPALTCALASSAPASFRLDSLKKLTLSGCKYPGDEMFVVGRFQQLQAYDRLEFLDLSFLILDPTPDQLELPALRTVPVGFTLPVRELNLTLEDSETTNKELATFLSYFPTLESLSFNDLAYRLDYDVILQGASTSLRHLALERYEPTEEPISTGKVFRRFPTLRSLKLNQVGVEEVVEDSLHLCSSLEVLHISCEHTPPPYSSLKRLLHRSVRPPKLSHIIVDLQRYSPYVGYDIAGLDELPTTPFAYGWQLPHEFDLEQALAFVSGASKIGLRVTGDIMESVQVQSLWNDGLAVIQSRIAARQYLDEARRRVTVKLDEDLARFLTELGEVP